MVNPEPIYTKYKHHQVELLGRPLGAGLEATVYEINLANQVAKIFKTKKLKDNAFMKSKIDRLKAMIANPVNLPDHDHIAIAWPTDLLINGSGEVIGFTMQKASGKRLVHYTEATSRQEEMPSVTWLNLHYIARNLAYMIDFLHQKNIILGDLKPQNVMVKDDQRVTIVDIDSVQFTNLEGLTYRISAASTEYAPREFKAGEHLKPSHDLFSLTVVIYEILLNCHPFHEATHGMDNEPVDNEIRKGNWSNKKNKNRNNFNLLSDNLQNLFACCFNKGHEDPNARPTARSWMTNLDEAIKTLTPCEKLYIPSKAGKYPMHYFVGSRIQCGWCDLLQVGEKHDIFYNEKTKVDKEENQVDKRNQPSISNGNPDSSNPLGGYLLTIVIIIVLILFILWFIRHF